MRESVVVAVTLFSLFHILLLPTKFLLASSALHRTPTGPSHTRGRTQVSELVRNEHRQYSELYSVRGNAKFASPMYKHTAILLQDRLVSQSQLHSPKEQNVFLLLAK